MSLKIVAISDTHQKHNQVKVPDGDLLVHCGDWTNQGTTAAILDFIKWFGSHPHRYKVCIAGNHELSLDGAHRNSMGALVEEKCAENNIKYLFNSGTEIEGYKIYGSPFTPRFYNWSFNRDRGKDIAQEWAKIPDDTNILITHGPPYSILDLVEDNYSNRNRDLHQGCEELLNRVTQLTKLKLHLFGHLHFQGSQQTTLNGVIFANAAICTEHYEPTNSPVVIEL